MTLPPNFLLPPLDLYFLAQNFFSAAMGFFGIVSRVYSGACQMLEKNRPGVSGSVTESSRPLMG